jgi:inosine-uridine nucleoside N-ribohydrolase
VGAMAMLHAFADKGEIKILATISSNAFNTTVPSISVLNTYFGRPEIPIGVTHKKQPNKDCPPKWAEAIIAKYPHNIKSNDEAMEAVKLYRKILSKQKDQSVTIVTVGFFTNLADLLDSKPDEYSDLTGKELIRKKVKLLVSMAASLPEGKLRGNEYNVNVDPAASQKVFTEWNTPVIISPFEVGKVIYTGIPLINDASIKNSPVKDAYQIALTAEKNTIGRCSWDQTTVLIAARGYEPYFNSTKLNFKIEDNGANVVIPGEKFIYLSFKQTPIAIQNTIEDLMKHQPKSK